MKYAILVFIFAQSMMASTLFSQSCRNLGEDYLRFRLETESGTFVKNSAVSVKITAFEDEKCQVPYLNYNQYFTVVDFHDGQLDLTAEKVTYQALSEEVASALRLIRYCDFSDWQKDIETSVTGKICEDYRQLQKDDTFYQILKIESQSLKLGFIDEKKRRSKRSKPPSAV